MKRRRGLPAKCLPELMLCVYGATLLRTTGIFPPGFGGAGRISYNLIPFAGGSIVPVALNFALFVPYGILLPLVFGGGEWRWYRAALAGGLTSAAIELLQLLGGRYAEADDLLINTFGCCCGWALYACARKLKKDPRGAAANFAALCAGVLICFAGIYAAGDNAGDRPDGLAAAQGDIVEVNVWAGGEKRASAAASDLYRRLETQLGNCGGHLLEIGPAPAGGPLNERDCFVEVIWASPQTLAFENAPGFMIGNADRLLYNADLNMLYWGRGAYQNELDYTKLNGELQEHRQEILTGYERLRDLIRGEFE